MKMKRAGSFAKELKNTGGFVGMNANWLWTTDDGVERYAMRLMEFEPGGHTSFHNHLEEHQFYFLDGDAIFVDKNGDEISLSPGDTLYCEPNEPHQIKNPGNGVMRMICTIPILPGGDGKSTTRVAEKEQDSSC